MFTGIITHLGKIKDKTENNLTIKTGNDLIARLSIGASIAVDGICLTVVGFDKDSFWLDFIPETEAKTNIKYLKVGDPVNLELPATASSLLSGHIVQGHIDGVAKLINATKVGNSHILKFSIPNILSKYIVPKGSIAVNGISLTVIETEKDQFSVGIIPHTWDNTMLHTLKVGDFVNIEADLLTKYMEKLLK